jgi:hypothetical protein
VHLLASAQKGSEVGSRTGMAPSCPRSGGTRFPRDVHFRMTTTVPAIYSVPRRATRFTAPATRDAVIGQGDDSETNPCQIHERRHVYAPAPLPPSRLAGPRRGPLCRSQPRARVESAMQRRHPLRRHGRTLARLTGHPVRRATGVQQSPPEIDPDSSGLGLIRDRRRQTGVPLILSGAERVTGGAGAAADSVAVAGRAGPGRGGLR